MADKSHIEWTDATWNPVTGCSIVSPGCARCYAMKLAGARLRNHPSRMGLTTASKTGPVWNGQVRFNEQWLTQPLEWMRPRTIFVCAHGDLFHENVPDEWIDKVFAVMALAPQHTFQVLTKRAKRMREYLANKVQCTAWTIDRSDVIEAEQQLIGGDVIENYAHHERPWPLPNVWLGVSAERQQEADERIPDLLATPAAVRFISAEPLLGPIDLTQIGGFRTGAKINVLDRRMRLNGLPMHLDQVIVGGESGSDARPMHPDWARSLRDQCAAAGVPYFFKQWGEYLPVGQVLPGCGKIHGATAVKPGRMKLHYGGTPEQAPKHAFAEHGVEFASTGDGRLTFRVGKHRAGRLLDGRTHDALPVRP